MTILKEIDGLISEGDGLGLFPIIQLALYSKWKTQSLIFLEKLSTDRYYLNFKDEVKTNCVKDVKTGIGILMAVKTDIKSGKISMVPDTTSSIKVKKNLFPMFFYKKLKSILIKSILILIPLVLGGISILDGTLVVMDFNDRIFESWSLWKKDIQPEALWETKKISFTNREGYKQIKNLSLRSGSIVFFIEGSDYAYNDEDKKFRKFKFKYKYVGDDYEYKVSHINPGRNIDPGRKEREIRKKENNKFSLSNNSHYDKGSEYLLEANKPAHYIVIRLKSLVKDHSTYARSFLNIEYFNYLSPTKKELMDVLDEGIDTDAIKPVFKEEDN